MRLRIRLRVRDRGTVLIELPDKYLDYVRIRLLRRVAVTDLGGLAHFLNNYLIPRVDSWRGYTEQHTCTFSLEHVYCRGNIMYARARCTSCGRLVFLVLERIRE